MTDQHNPLPIGAEILERDSADSSDDLAISLARQGASDALIASIVGTDGVARVRAAADATR